MTFTRSRALRLVAILLALQTAVLAGPGAASATVSYALIQGSGSSWAANAVNQWVADVDAKGLRVVYTANGAAQGRKDYANKSTDFGVTDSPYRGKDPTTGATDSPLGRSFAYLPIVAGGTSFPYHVEVGGALVRDIRLSGDTIAKIFTNQITNWNDPAITSDNNGRALPSIPIIPVVRADGAGVTNQFTTWMVSQHADLWTACNGGKNAPTDYFPLNCGDTRGPQKAQSGSDGVMNYVKSAGANGTIAMEEYSYPLMADFPVVKVLNAAGYYTLPTQYNVAVALTMAEINDDPNDPNYLTQKLDRVYTNPDKRTYPLSSYVYAIIPTASDDSRMTTSKRQTIVDFLKHAICEGQSEIGPIGYSPLPVNLVQASFTQVNKLKLADDGVEFDASIIQDVHDCHNPTFVPGDPSQNHLAEIAPFPADCDRPGQGPCGATVGSFNENPGSDGEIPADAASGGGSGGKAGSGGGGPGGGSGGGSGAAGGGSGGGGDGGAGTGGTAEPSDLPTVDSDGDGVPDAPAGGADPAAAGGSTDGTSADGGVAPASVVATTVAADSAAGPAGVLTALVVGLFLGALVVPTAVSHLARRKARG
ncbi:MULTISPECIES: substrate-binding domain-containing protein [Nocardioides]|uniref:substrate-binding domain-containing protein n=1 Tax=Nocardioides TaxID=1839 RepID=UPI0018DFA350|nr:MULTISPECIES: substrate-binding domain-containing protein [unclassified Nocardioides]